VTYGGDSGNRIFVLYLRCPFIRVSVIRSSTVSYFSGSQTVKRGDERLHILFSKVSVGTSVSNEIDFTQLLNNKSGMLYIPYNRTVCVSSLINTSKRCYLLNKCSV
jgi:hypothetical protein